MVKIKTEQIEQLIQIIHEQNAWYIGAIGFVIAVMTIFLTFYSFQQKKISDEQVKKFTAEIKKAEKISADLKDSNESIIQFSLDMMHRENRWVTTNWDQRARMFLAAKSMYLKYYRDNQELKLDLEKAKLDVINASKQSFEVLLKQDGKEYIVGAVDEHKEWHDRLKSAYIMKKSAKGFVYRTLEKVNYSEMKEIGHDLDKPNVQNEWFCLLDKVNNFWINETLD